jgi:hypothetical protein
MMNAETVAVSAPCMPVTAETTKPSSLRELRATQSAIGLRWHNGCSTAMLMDPVFIISGVGSLAIGALLIAFRKFIGAWLNRMNRSVRQRHQDDLTGQNKWLIGNAFTVSTSDFAPGKFRLLGIVFLIQGVVFFILGAVLSHGR